MIEPLELRIAPAMVSIVGNTASWTDFDGDKITLKWTAGNAPIFTSADVGSGLIVNRIIFNSSNTGAAVTLGVQAAGGGDGRVDLGRVDADGTALASWSSPRATLAEVDAGDGANSFKTFVSGGLGVHSVGLFTNSGGDGVSTISGTVGTFTVNGDIAATKLLFTTQGLTKVGKVDIKGSLLGSAATTPANGPSGVLELSVDSVGSVSIGGSIVGGKTTGTGVLQAVTTSLIGTITVKGSLLGGEGAGSGSMTFAAVKSLNLGGDVKGGGVDSTGKINGFSVDSLTIGGSIIGGAASDTGVVGFSTGTTAGKLPNVTIKGSILGTPRLGAGSNSVTAALSISGDAGTVSIGRDLIGGSNAAGISVGYNGALLFGGNVKTLSIRGDVQGTDGLPVAILARGTTPAAAGSFAAIGKLTIGGDVNLAYIAAGHAADLSSLANRIGSAENPDAGIGSVSVGGDWLHSSLTAGIDDAASNGVDLADTRSAGDGGRLALIGPISSKGDVLDNGAFAGTSGFAAEKIAKLTAGGANLFTTGSATRVLNWDQRVFVREI